MTAVATGPWQRVGVWWARMRTGSSQESFSTESRYFWIDNDTEHKSCAAEWCTQNIVSRDAPNISVVMKKTSGFSLFNYLTEEFYAFQPSGNNPFICLRPVVHCYCQCVWGVQLCCIGTHMRCTVDDIPTSFRVAISAVAVVIDHRLHTM